MAGATAQSVRRWRAQRWFLAGQAQSLDEATASLPPLAAGPGAYLSLFARVKGFRARTLERALLKGGFLCVMPIFGLGDVLVAPPIAPLYAATRGFIARRNARRTKRWRALEDQFGEQSAALHGVLSGAPAAAGELSRAPTAIAALDEMARRGQALKVPGDQRLDGRFSYGKPPRELAGASLQVEGYAFLEDLALEFFRFAGPATRDDFSWWSGVSPPAGRHSIEDLSGLIGEIDIEGERKAFFMREEDAADLRQGHGVETSRVCLLPSMDCARFALRSGFAALCDERMAARYVPAARRARGSLAGGPRFLTFGGRIGGKWEPAGPDRIEVEAIRPRSIDEGFASTQAGTDLLEFLRSEIPWALSPDQRGRSALL